MEFPGGEGQSQTDEKEVINVNVKVTRPVDRV